MDAGWEEPTRATPPPRASEDETRTIPIDELDALLERSTDRADGATAALSAGEIDDLLDPAATVEAPRSSLRGAGFGRIKPPAPRAAAPDRPVAFDDELGAAFDAMAGPPEAGPSAYAAMPYGGVVPPMPPYPPTAPGPGWAPAAYDEDGPTRDSLPTELVQQPGQAAPASPGPVAGMPATVALHAWGQGEPATVDLRLWMAAEGAPAPTATSSTPPVVQPASASWPVAAPAPAAPPAPGAPASMPAPSAPSPPAAAFADPRAAGAPPSEGMSSGSRAGMFAALGMSFVTIVGLTAFLLLRSPGGAAPSDPAEPQAKPSSAPAVAPTGAGAAGPQPLRGEAAARAALQRLAEGVRACSRDVIGALPGTAPAVPTTFRLMKQGVYTSLPGDYRSPVYSCTSFRLAEPQEFQIQWQVSKGGAEGMAIAWLDADADGQVDRALGIRAKLVKKGEVELGEIEALQPLPAVAITR